MSLRRAATPYHYLRSTPGPRRRRARNRLRVGFQVFDTRSWRNWQTHCLEVAGAIPWRFKSSRPHQKLSSNWAGTKIPAFRFSPPLCRGRVPSIQNGTSVRRLLTGRTARDSSRAPFPEFLLVTFQDIIFRRENDTNLLLVSEHRALLRYEIETGGSLLPAPGCLVSHFQHGQVSRRRSQLGECRLNGDSFRRAAVHAPQSLRFVIRVVPAMWQQNDNVTFGQSRNVPLTTPGLGNAGRTTTDDPSR